MSIFEEPIGKPPKPIGPREDVARAQLKPGVIVHRYTEVNRLGKIVMKVPCCNRLAKLEEAWTSYLVLCTHCDIPYQATAIPDADGSRWGVLTVEDIPFITTRRR